MDIYRTPLLTAREVARHLQMHESTLDRWIRTQAADAPLVHAVVPERRGWPRMPFVAIIEAHVLKALRDLGFSHAAIESAAAAVRREFGTEYALASQRIASDGVALFIKTADEGLVHAVNGDHAIREVLNDFLRFVSWDDEGAPKALRLRQYRGAEVVIDPRFGWGAPVLRESKVPVEALSSLWQAGEPMAAIAEEYELPLTMVEDALRGSAA